jgi:hypothetical protein
MTIGIVCDHLLWFRVVSQTGNHLVRLLAEQMDESGNQVPHSVARGACGGLPSIPQAVVAEAAPLPRLADSTAALYASPLEHKLLKKRTFTCSPLKQGVGGSGSLGSIRVHGRVDCHLAVLGR